MEKQISFYEAERWREEESNRVYDPWRSRSDFYQMVVDGTIYQVYAHLFQSPSYIEIDESQLKRIDKLFKSFTFDWETVLANETMERYIYHGNCIEGSVVSFSQTREILAKGLRSDLNVSIVGFLEVLNHKVALTELLSSLQNNESLTEDLILRMHRSLMMHLLQISGSYRRMNVALSSKKVLLADYYEVPGLLRKFIQYVNSEEFLKEHPIKQACLIHYNFASIHPFQDGNGRMSRLLMNYVLLRAKFPIIIIEQETRSVYFQSIEDHLNLSKSRNTISFESPLCNFISKQILTNI